MSESGQGGGRRRVLSGMRPTGKLHLGNYMGALYNWVRLQEEYECYFFIADYHALTTDYADTSRLLTNVFEIAVDFLAAGLDPEKCTIFVQSHVPQHAELNLLFSMFTPLSWLERVPTYKDQQEQLRDKDLATYGFLGYPLLQSADILLYQPDYVPVGQDQVAHVELTREVSRRFNSLYSPRHVEVDENGVESEVPDPSRLILPEPQVLLTPSPKLPGIDGRKMSKSYGNSILLTERPGDVEEKMSRMSNGGQRNPQSRPGDPDICPVGDMHSLFSDTRMNEYVRQGCRTAAIRCVECKAMAANGINRHIQPIRLRREELESKPEQVWEILETGSDRARQRSEATMQQVREVTGVSRTRRPVPEERKYLHGLTYSNTHDLTLHADWWELDRVYRSRNLREHWRALIVPTDIAIKQESERVYVTRKGKRVYVTTAREEKTKLNCWTFEVKVKNVRTYEVMVLLCWNREFGLADYVVPQIAFVKPWTALKKSLGKENPRFTLTLIDGIAWLRFPESEPIDVTAYRGRYEAMS